MSRWQVRVARPDDLGALAFQHHRERDGPRADHELAQIAPQQIPEVECKRRVASSFAEDGAKLGASGFL